MAADNQKTVKVEYICSENCIGCYSFAGGSARNLATAANIMSRATNGGGPMGKVVTDASLETMWNDIPIGRENAASYEDLQRVWGVTSRWVRQVLHDLSSYDNGDGYILIRSNKCRGFYRTDDRAEIEAYKQECLNKGRAHFAPVRKINRVLATSGTQYCMENNMRAVREGLLLTQDEVARYMGIYFPGFDRPMLSKMENGLCYPTPEQLERLTTLYGCTSRVLFPAWNFTKEAN